MITISNTDVVGWEHAIRGMRNPLNSWSKSDSFWQTTDYDTLNENDIYEYEIGPNDLSLMKRLRKAGTDHRKFMRMIVVYVDITAPLYFWKEFSTYKIGTVANSCSTMHTIHKHEFTIEDFSCENLMSIVDEGAPVCENLSYGVSCYPIDILELTIEILNKSRELYLETKDKKYWWQMIQLLPSSYNQKRTVMLNYEVLANMYKSRKDHKLSEWVSLCSWIESLPYSQLIIGENYGAMD